MFDKIQKQAIKRAKARSKNLIGREKEKLIESTKDLLRERQNYHHQHELNLDEFYEDEANAGFRSLVQKLDTSLTQELSLGIT